MAQTKKDYMEKTLRKKERPKQKVNQASNGKESQSLSNQDVTDHGKSLRVKGQEPKKRGRPKKNSSEKLSADKTESKVLKNVRTRGRPAKVVKMQVTRKTGIPKKTSVVKHNKLDKKSAETSDDSISQKRKSSRKILPKEQKQDNIGFVDKPKTKKGDSIKPQRKSTKKLILTEEKKAGGKIQAVKKTLKKRGRPRKQLVVEQNDEKENDKHRKRGRPRKDSSVKQDQNKEVPNKEIDNPEKEVQEAKRVEEKPSTTSRKRGRPLKNVEKEDVEESDAPKKRGRPNARTLKDTQNETKNGENSVDESTIDKTQDDSPRKRGRPQKNKPQEIIDKNSKEKRSRPQKARV